MLDDLIKMMCVPECDLRGSAIPFDRALESLEIGRGRPERKGSELPEDIGGVVDDDTGLLMPDADVFTEALPETPVPALGGIDVNGEFAGDRRMQGQRRILDFTLVRICHNRFEPQDEAQGLASGHEERRGEMPV